MKKTFFVFLYAYAEKRENANLRKTIAHYNNAVRKNCSVKVRFVDKKRHFRKFNTFFFGNIV